MSDYKKINFSEDYDLFLFKTVDTTMNVAKKIKKDLSNETKKNVAIIAENQTIGRGRFNRVWESITGNLNLSIIVIPEKYNIKSMNDIYQMSFLFSLSILETIKSFLDKNNLSIKCKWPNDVFVNNKKIAGVLTESSVFFNNNELVIDYLCIGIGVNIEKPAKNTESVCLNDFLINSTNVSYMQFFEILIHNINENLKIFKETKFSEIKKTWLSNAYKINEYVQVKLQNNNETQFIDGIFVDIDNTGNIILNKNESLVQVNIGDVL